MSQNPFQSPMTHDAATAYPVGEVQLATRGARFAGAFIDNLLTGLCGFAAGMLLALSGAITFSAGENQGYYTLIGYLGALPLLVYQWYLIATTGQTIGKKIMGTKIVNYATGEPVDFVKGVILRQWVLIGLSLIPFVGGIVGLIDALIIFGGERRCGHDLIAGTKVIAVSR